jgi:hypothetical protein
VRKRNLEKENEDLKNIVKYFIHKYSFGDNEMAIEPAEIKKMKEYELCEFRNLGTYNRIFKMFGNENLYERQFAEQGKAKK